MIKYTNTRRFFPLLAAALGFCFPTKFVFAQQTPCLFDSLYPAHRLETAEAGIRTGFQKRILQAADNHASDDSIRIIPVVVHVIHNGGTENISTAQIESQIRILNEDYGKLTGTPGDGDGVDTRVRFCLTKIDPQGRCTDGIVRLKTPLTAHKPVDRATLKQLSFWDNTRYLNVYVVKSITGGVGGYSSFPYAPPDEDGIVVRANLFGNVGTAASSGGRTMTHEVGHWFGLYHTFNGGCGQDTCADGDYVCDTPPVANPNYTCSLNANSCANDSPNLPDQVRNYMDYSPDDCKNKFTQGQKERIVATLDTVRTLIWSPANLASTGCDSAYQAPAICPVAVDFVTLTPTVCTGNQVYFMDRSLNAATAWQWSFPGGTPANSTLQNPTVKYDTVGVYPVTLIAWNANGSDTLTLNNYIEVTEPGVGAPLPFARNFDDGQYPPEGISIINPDGGIAWELDSAAARSVPYSMRINNLINTNYGTRDEIELPFLDLTTAHPDSMVRMTFWWAYARSDANYSDELIVQLSKDCGFNYTQILTKSGSTLVTGPTQTTPFIPDASQWKKATINLNAYRTEHYVKIRLVNVTDGGNNLYIDDLYVGDGGTVTATDELQSGMRSVRFFPNPARDYVQFLIPPGLNTPVHIRAYDTPGKLLRDYGEYASNSSPILNLAGLPPGFLFFTLQFVGLSYTTRVAKLP
ncbi:MAG: PKD domain-containing protein [Lewinellaceae bacterium]|nr:PKD domain-containing protein [Lewinellaceae bacterium]